MTPESETREAFQDLSREVLDWYFRSNPIQATMAGVHDYDAELGEWSDEAIRERIDQARRFVARLEAIGPDPLTPDERVDRELLLAQLEVGVRHEEEVREWQRSPMYGHLALYGCYLLLFREFAPLEQRLEATLGRLRQIPRVLAEGKANLTEPVRVFVETALDTLAAGAGFFQGLVPVFIAQARSQALRKELEAANARAVEALEDFRSHVERLLPEAGPEFGVGREMFDYLLRRRHYLDYDAESLHTKGWELFEETQRLMAETAREIDPTKTLDEVIDDLKRNHPAAEELLDTYRHWMEAGRRWVVERGIVDIPPGERLIVEETPVFQRPLIPYAAYLPPAAFEENQTGRFWVTPVDPSDPPERREERLRDQCHYKIPITAIHEAYPGHHLQLVWSNRHPSRVRRLIDSTLLAEGWAFYLEELAEELGFVSGPEYRLLRLKDQLWRAARIILDAALHAHGLTVDQAVDFLVEKVHLARPNALAEVRRYAMTPTQPMSYLIGKLEILKLVEDYRRAKGPGVELRRMHGDLLSHGTIPPAVLRRILLG